LDGGGEPVGNPYPIFRHGEGHGGPEDGGKRATRAGGREEGRKGRKEGGSKERVEWMSHKTKERRGRSRGGGGEKGGKEGDIPHL
jgi:hypothetical protein